MDYSKAITAIYAFPVPTDQGDITTLLQKMIASYLVHNGYSNTAEAFSRISDQHLSENLYSIKKRQSIMKLVLAGKIGQAMELTANTYPGVLENKKLMFMLKCRRFIEMINGTDTMEFPHTTINSKNATTEIIQDESNNCTETTETANHKPKFQYVADKAAATANKLPVKQGAINNNYFNDVDMDIDHDISTSNDICSTPGADDMDKVVSDFDRILAFGKDLMRMGRQMDKDHLLSDEERQMMEAAFSLVAYSNPWSSLLSWQFCPSKREVVCSVLNSAILRSMGQPWRPSLEVCVAHASELLQLTQFRNEAHRFFNLDDDL